MRGMIIWICIAVLLSGSTIKSQEANRPETGLDFEGNKVFSKRELLDAANSCFAKYSWPEGERDSAKIEYCLHKVRQFIFAKGYLRATLGEPRKEQTKNGWKTIVSVNEGALYRLGKVEIRGSTLFSPGQILEITGLKTGDIADGESLSEGLYERVKKVYGKFGFIQYTAEIEPNFHLKAGEGEGTVDFALTIDEGQAFTIRSISFEGNGNVPKNDLMREMLVRTGEIFNRELFDESLKRISQSGQFEVIDADKDVDYSSQDRTIPLLDLTIHLRRKPGN